jgi:hypothetical protein
LSVTTPLLKPWSVSSLISLPFVNSKLIFEYAFSLGQRGGYLLTFGIKNSFLHFFIKFLLLVSQFFGRLYIFGSLTWPCY